MVARYFRSSLMSERIVKCSLLFARSVPGGRWLACGGKADVGLHVEKICAELVDFGEAGAAVKGVDVVGGEGDGSGIGCWEGHVVVLTVVGVML